MEINNQSNKSEIITLLLADMRNRKLIMGLEATGLATDDFNTNLSYLIFSKMEIDKQYHVIVFNWYEDTIYSLLDTDLDKFRTHQVFLAERLYYALEEKREQLQSNLVFTNKTKFTFRKWGWFKRFDN
jgi:hypothetical protein